MDFEPQQTLREIQKLDCYDDYLRIARAEIASDPSNTRLRQLVEALEEFMREASSSFALTAGTPTNTCQNLAVKCSQGQ